MADKVENKTADESATPQFTAEQIAALTALITPKAEGEQSKPEPQKLSAEFSVKEELPYRFDGSKGEHEFSSDIINAARFRDGEAQARLDKFMSVAFDVTQANVDEVNPVGQRPDLFVDNLAYVTPIWNAIAKEPLSGPTPFVVPKYNSSSGLVGDHTEGVEPSEGSYTTTGQTITPGAVSGKYELTREVVDAGGNPQVSGLIWRQVQRDYAENLEAKAAALLASLSPTELVTIAAGDADDVLAGKLEGGLASLQFVRGGDRFDRFVGQQDLYQALVAARDADGRVLYPQVGATNANGGVAPGFTTINVGGKVLIPAWALGASSGNASKSYLFSSEDVHGWATPPRQLQFEYQVATITVGVWGYQATANTRLAGVRKVTYDPTA